MTKLTYEELEARLANLSEWTKKCEHELAQFHEAMERERKPDWELSLKQLAAELDSASEYPASAPKRIPEYLKRAARELRYMATNFTLKANFVPAELKIKELEKQVEEAQKQNCALREALANIQNRELSTTETAFEAWDALTEIAKQALSTPAP